MVLLVSKIILCDKRLQFRRRSVAYKVFCTDLFMSYKLPPFTSHQETSSSHILQPTEISTHELLVFTHVIIGNFIFNKHKMSLNEHWKEFLREIQASRMATTKIKHWIMFWPTFMNTIQEYHSLRIRLGIRHGFCLCLCFGAINSSCHDVTWKTKDTSFIHQGSEREEPGNKVECSEVPQTCHFRSNYYSLNHYLFRCCFT